MPSLAGAANQLNILKKELKLDKIFLASDAPKHGMPVHYCVGRLTYLVLGLGTLCYSACYTV